MGEPGQHQMPLVGEPLRRLPILPKRQNGRAIDSFNCTSPWPKPPRPQSQAAGLWHTPAMIKSNEKKLSLPHEGFFSLFCSFFSLFLLGTRAVRLIERSKLSRSNDSPISVVGPMILHNAFQERSLQPAIRGRATGNIFEKSEKRCRQTSKRGFFTTRVCTSYTYFRK